VAVKIAAALASTFGSGWIQDQTSNMFQIFACPTARSPLFGWTPLETVRGAHGHPADIESQPTERGCRDLAIPIIR
jgi:hypothetical protein